MRFRWPLPNQVSMRIKLNGRHRKVSRNEWNEIIFVDQTGSTAAIDEMLYAKKCENNFGFLVRNDGKEFNFRKWISVVVVGGPDNPMELIKMRIRWTRDGVIGTERNARWGQCRKRNAECSDKHAIIWCDTVVRLLQNTVGIAINGKIEISIIFFLSIFGSRISRRNCRSLQVWCFFLSSDLISFNVGSSEISKYQRMPRLPRCSRTF